MPQTTEKITLFAPDIHCGHCEQKIQRAVGSVAGVQTVTPSRDTKMVDVEFDPNLVTQDTIISTMYEAGYPAKAGFTAAS